MAGDLKSYFSAVGKTALLTRQEEVELSKLIEAGDKRARDRMIRANIRLAISIAKNYANKSCDIEDLIQESSMGLIKAVDRFDYRRGFKFSTYACWWIKQAVRQYVAAHSGSIKLPAYARGTLYKMRKVAEEYEEEFGVPPSQKELADLLGTSVATLQSLIKSSASTVSLGSSAFRSDPNSDRTMHDTLVDPDAVDPDDEIDRKRLIGVVREALSNLTPREEIVLRLRFGISEDELNMASRPNRQ
jgi:RNA polymerase primary sigma factor